MALGIASVKATAETAVEALFNLDPFLLDEETLNKLLRVCPTAEEEKLLKDNSHRITEVTYQEQFIFKLLKVPRLSNRLQSLLFNMSFDIQFIEYNRSLEHLSQAYEAVHKNKELN